MSLLGIDVGTSQCKAVAFSASGDILATATHDYTPSFPAPGRVEMDPRLYWDAFGDVTRRAAAATQADPITALALSSQGETFFPVDAKGDPVGPAILNIDNRAAAESRWCEQHLGRQRLFRTTGLVPHPMYPLTKFRWLQQHQPDLVARTTRFATLIDDLMRRLGVEPAIDFSLASRFLAFDVRHRQWSADILAAAGLQPGQLPAAVPAGTVAGQLSRSVAANLGLAPGTTVVVGGHDQPVGAVGTGAIAPGMVADSAGTYECLLATVATPSVDDVALQANLNSGCHVLPGLYGTIVYFPSGLMVKWFHDLFAAGGDDDQAGYRDLEAHVPAGPTGLCITPHLIGTCAPSFDPRATGTITGLTPTTDRYALYKGVLEGVACELNIVVEALSRAVGRLDAIRITGGGARSPLGVQLRAALTGCRMHLMRSREAVCLGTAIVAGVAAGVFRDYPQAVAQMVRVAETIDPNPDWTKAYQRQLQQYRLLYPALESVRKE